MAGTFSRLIPTIDPPEEWARITDGAFGNIPSTLPPGAWVNTSRLPLDHKLSVQLQCPHPCMSSNQSCAEHEVSSRHNHKVPASCNPLRLRQHRLTQVCHALCDCGDETLTHAACVLAEHLDGGKGQAYAGMPCEKKSWKV